MFLNILRISASNVLKMFLNIIVRGLLLLLLLFISLSHGTHYNEFN